MQAAELIIECPVAAAVALAAAPQAQTDAEYDTRRCESRDTRRALLDFVRILLSAASCNNTCTATPDSLSQLEGCRCW